MVSSFVLMLRKKDNKTVRDGIAGKYIKKENPPEIPSN
jgi:hypothetical protein